jgi:hypothetical protein
MPLRVIALSEGRIESSVAPSPVERFSKSFPSDLDLSRFTPPTDRHEARAWSVRPWRNHATAGRCSNSRRRDLMASGDGPIATDQPDAIRSAWSAAGSRARRRPRAALERAIVDIASPTLVTSVAANTVQLQDVPVKPSAGLEPATLPYHHGDFASPSASAVGRTDSPRSTVAAQLPSRFSASSEREPGSAA